MAICIKCGNEASSCLCDKCKSEIDIESLCNEVIAYRPGCGENPLWEKMCSEMSSPYNFRNLAFALSDELPTPRKEYIRVMSQTGSSSNVSKDSRQWFYETYAVIKDDDGLTQLEKNRLHGIAVGAYYMDYMYPVADEIATELSEEAELPWQAYYNLVDFYTKTRRYDTADEIITDALNKFADDAFVVQTMQNRAAENAKQIEKANTGKNEYMPNPKENRDEVRQKYIDFLASIGIEATKPVSANKAKNVIPRDQYPAPVETRDTNLPSFVAFDVETTGRNTKIDSIIEIGAIRVVGDKIVESAEFTFQELTQPLDHKKVSAEITELTGITNEEAYAGRVIWEVFPDFAKFAGDNVLLGFNCMAFDSKLMVRAGRYSNLIINNKYFDVMRYAMQMKDKLGISKKPSLEELADKFGVENPQAHRALADAITTARVFLKLKELDDGAGNDSVEDMLSDLDEW